ncbi:MAG: hypothetical protein RIS35_3702, partial [Pseudomonadota bacterium]
MRRLTFPLRPLFFRWLLTLLALGL